MKKRYPLLLAAVRGNRLDLRNTDFDTGQPTRRGEYTLADETYAATDTDIRRNVCSCATRRPRRSAPRRSGSGPSARINSSIT